MKGTKKEKITKKADKDKQSWRCTEKYKTSGPVVAPTQWARVFFPRE
jgi:hypothetical protein